MKDKRLLPYLSAALSVVRSLSRLAGPFCAIWFFAFVGEAMVHCRSAPARMARCSRAIARGFVQFRGAGARHILVPLGLHPRVKAMSVSLNLHDQHDALLGTRTHFARSAAIGAFRSGHISQSALGSACGVHRRANRAKHGCSSARSAAAVGGDLGAPNTDSLLSAMVVSLQSEIDEWRRCSLLVADAPPSSFTFRSASCVDACTQSPPAAQPAHVLVPPPLAVEGGACGAGWSASARGTSPTAADADGSRTVLALPVSPIAAVQSPSVARGAHVCAPFPARVVVGRSPGACAAECWVPPATASAAGYGADSGRDFISPKSCVGAPSYSSTSSLSVRRTSV